MSFVSHQSAKPSHYNKESAHYDEFNEKKSKAINQFIESILKKYKAKSVLDLTCGTGSQVFWLAKGAFEVVGLDINAKMLQIAKSKAIDKNLNLNFIKADMRTARIGKFDAAITIFNAIGHLTKSDFEKAIRNIHSNLKNHGLYIFDIFNLSYLLHKNNITQLTIDWQETVGNSKIRDIQYSTIDEEGILASYTTHYEQHGTNKLKISQHTQTLQVYTNHQLKEMLHRSGFKVIRQCGVDGSRFIQNKTERILTVAKKLK